MITYIFFNTIVFNNNLVVRWCGYNSFSVGVVMSNNVINYIEEVGYVYQGKLFFIA